MTVFRMDRRRAQKYEQKPHDPGRKSAPLNFHARHAVGLYRFERDGFGGEGRSLNCLMLPQPMMRLGQVTHRQCFNVQGLGRKRDLYSHVLGDLLDIKQQPVPFGVFGLKVICV